MKMIKKDYQNAFFRKIVEVLMKLKDNDYVSIIRRKNDVSYSYLDDCVASLEKYKLITSVKKGRTKVVRLTEKGRNVQSLLLKIDNLMKNEKISLEET